MQENNYLVMGLKVASNFVQKQPTLWPKLNRLADRFFMGLPLGDLTGGTGVAEASSAKVQAPSNQHGGFGHQIPPSEVEGGHIPSPLHTSSIQDNSYNLTSKLPTTRYASQSLKLPQPTDSWPIKTLFTSMGAEKVLQVTQGYQIQFMTEPVQTHTPVSMFTTQEDQNLIDQEVQELLAKQAVHFVSKNSQNTQGFISSLFVVPKKGGGSPASNKPKTLEHFPALRTLQNGVNKHAKRSPKKRRLFSENRLKGCISDSAGLEGTPKVPSISLEGLPPGVRLPPLWSGECSTSIHQTSLHLV